ncbi:MAG: endo-1,4-beta-xylanase [Planctomycetota bacterium]
MNPFKRTLVTLFVGLVTMGSGASLAGSPRVLATTDDFRLDADPTAGTISRSRTGIIANSRQRHAEAWSVQAQTAPIAESVGVGDVFCLRFRARAVSHGPGSMHVLLAKNDPWVPIEQQNGFQTVEVPSHWHEFVVCFRADRDFAGGTIYAAMQLATRRQTIEIDDVQLVAYGDVDEATLPYAPLNYTPADSAWHEAAQAEIARHRQSELSVRVVRANGTPVKSAIVDIQQQCHAYAFGTFVGDTPIHDGEDADEFRQQTLRWFNRVTLPRYWADWGTDTTRGIVRADSIAEWAYREDLELKSHVLLYPQCIPDRVKALADDPTAFRHELDAAIARTLRRTKALQCVAWDGLNELRDVTLVADVLGDSYYASVFNFANQQQPDAVWFLNEYGILTGGPRRAGYLETFRNQLRRIQRSGGVVEGLGLQGHFQSELISMPQATAILDDLASEGLPIEITEFDVDTRDEAAQAAFTRDFLTAVFAHPSTTGFTTWGFWQGDMWRPNGAMIRRDWSLKPNGQVWQELVYDRWWTSEQLKTNDEGVATTRVYKGRHRIKAAAEDFMRVGDFEITEDSNTTLRIGI